MMVGADKRSLSLSEASRRPRIIIASINAARVEAFDAAQTATWLRSAA